MARDLLDKLSLTVPIFQAPMAGVSTPQMAAAVARSGGLGGLGLGASTPQEAKAAILAVQTSTDGAFCANFFCHATPKADRAVEAAWIARAAPLFQAMNSVPPDGLRDIYDSFSGNDAMMRIVLETRPPVVSFHFGLPTADQIAALREAGIVLVASATALPEAQAIEAAGLDAVIAQGFEAGGHRGIFDPDGPDAEMGTEDLTRLLRQNLSLPVIAAGGLMSGRDVAAAVGWGAVAGQLGTAFIACPESAADAGYRARLTAGGTVMTRAISGRPARCLENRLTEWAHGVAPAEVPAYPRAYDLAKVLISASKDTGQPGIGAQWAGTAASRARPMPAEHLMQVLRDEYQSRPGD